MSLLTETESHAFQSFLASIDNPEPPLDEWQMYTSVNPDDVPIPHAHGREALSKATKDLMALDGQPWNAASPNPAVPYQFQNQPRHGQYHGQHDQHHTGNPYPSYHHQQPPHDPFGYLHKPAMQSHSSHSVHSPIAIAPKHTIGTDSPTPPPASASTSSSRSSSSATPTPTPTPSITSYPQNTIRGSSPHHNQSAKRQMEHEYTHTSNKRFRPSPTSSNPAKQMLPTQWQSNHSQHPPQTHTHPSLSARPRGQHSSSSPTSSHPHPDTRPPTSRQNSGSHVAARPPKPTLLSPSQKKANHIQSEQKRRANIRRGYEALCEAVPALREALMEEELRNGRSPSNGRGGDSERDIKDMKGRAARTKRGRGRGKSEDGPEKVDGRAGPRSENVVLSKTIEYIELLLRERSALLSRFQNARSALPPNHPALILNSQSFESSLSPGCSKPPPNGVPVPLWQREWSGGEGRIGDDDDELDDEGLDD